MEKERKPSFGVALITFIIMVAVIAIGMVVFKLNVGLMMFIAWLIVIPVGIYLKYTFEEMQKMAFDQLRVIMEAMFIVIAVGALIGGWMVAGTVPTIIYYGLNLMTPTTFLVTTMILCTIMSLCTGSSWGTLGTVGVAMSGVAVGMGIDPALAAGAIISGAWFGDKMTPVSDTTILAPAVSGGNSVMNHIKHMLWTAGPAYIVGLIVFTIWGFKLDASMDMSKITELMNGLNSEFHLGIIPLIPAVIVVALLVTNKPPLLAVLLGAVSASLIAIFYQGADITSAFKALYYGYFGESGLAILDKILNTGGIKSMWDTVGIFFFAVGLGGMLDRTGILNALLEPLVRRTKSVSTLIIITMLVAFLANAIGCSTTFGVAITGTIMEPIYRRFRIRPENLSRTIEDVGTIGAPLIPWNTSGIYAAGLLGVSTLSYLPYCVLNYTVPLFTLLFAFTGFTINNLDEGEEYGEAKVYKSKFNKKARLYNTES